MFTRRDAVITFGQKGYIRQDVYERMGSNAYAQIKGQYRSGMGTAAGYWSPDSVWESNCTEFNN